MPELFDFLFGFCSVMLLCAALAALGRGRPSGLEPLEVLEARRVRQ